MDGSLGANRPVDAQHNHDGPFLCSPDNGHSVTCDLQLQPVKCVSNGVREVCVKLKERTRLCLT